MPIQIRWISRLLLLVLLTGHTHTVSATHGNFVDHLVHDEAYLQVFYDTHYFSEGRDNLDGADMQSSMLSLKYDAFELLIWNGWGFDANYNELNITPTYYFDYKNLSFYVNYNRLQFTEQGTYDNEVGSGVSYKLPRENFFLDFDWYHSFQADGSFMEFSVAHVHEVEDQFRLESRVIMGINENYIPDGHDGLNHLALRLTGEYRLLSNLNLHGMLAYNHAIDRQVNRYAGDALLQSQAWGRIGLELLF